MKLQLQKEDWKTRGLLPPISYTPNVTIVKTPTDKSDSLNVDIKTQPGDKDTETVAIYVPLFQTGSA